jgi:hypothetical protein
MHQQMRRAPTVLQSFSTHPLSQDIKTRHVVNKLVSASLHPLSAGLSSLAAATGIFHLEPSRSGFFSFGLNRDAC